MRLVGESGDVAEPTLDVYPLAVGCVLWTVPPLLSAVAVKGTLSSEPGPRARGAPPRPGAHLLHILQVQVVLDAARGLPAHLPVARQQVHVVDPAVQVLGGRPRLPFWVGKESDNKKSESPLRTT